MDKHHRSDSSPVFQIGPRSNVLIQGGEFVQHNSAGHNCYNATDGFKHLQAHVATAAFDSGQHVDAPKCHPNTRQAVQDDIMDWILPPVMRLKWMLWLNGAAGAGKSAIARSIVALCLSQNIPIARFFFFRTDSTRNNIKPVVATLLYQLIDQIPDLLAIVVPKIELDPLIFEKSLETQLQFLIFEPLRQLHHGFPLKKAVILLFDGVDECNGGQNQVDLVRSISTFLDGRDLPIAVLFVSRTEYELKQIFRSTNVSTNLLQLALDDHYLPDNDIRLFLDDKFNEIRETHPFSQYLPKHWPDPAHVKQIVQKSSGQFIYAAVVIGFVSSPRKHPAQQLEIVRGVRPAGKSTPFAQLDALYCHIFSRVEDCERTLLLLAAVMFGVVSETVIGCIRHLFHKTWDDIPVLLAELSSVVAFKRYKTIGFLHASLPDFLLDQSRSQQYYLNKGVWCTRLSIHCFHQIANGVPRCYYPLTMDFLRHAEVTEDLKQNALAMDFNNIIFLWNMCTYPDMYLTNIQKLDFGDNGEMYQAYLNRLTRQVIELPYHYPYDALSELRKHHDISAILAQIENEKAAALELQRNNETGQDSAAFDPYSAYPKDPRFGKDRVSLNKYIQSARNMIAQFPYL